MISTHGARRRSGCVATAGAQETLGGRSILVRFVIARLAAEAWRFEQAYSDDGGRSWEINWVATDTRVP